jgi:hypothetical protein
MFDWFKQKRPESPQRLEQAQPAILPALRTASSIEEENEYVMKEICDCGGSFRPKTRKSTLDSGQTVDSVEAECNICYQPKQFAFLYQGATVSEECGSRNETLIDTDLSEREPRDHHYLFAHRVLPRAVFSDPRAFLQMISASQSQRVLEDLWHRIGERAEEPVKTERGKPALSISSHSFFGRPSIVIALPTPVATTEAWFIAVVSEDEEINDPWRYFVLENTCSKASEPLAVLCEWFEDGSRENHKQTIFPSLENMSVAVERVLDIEGRRRRANMRIDVGRKWLPSEPSTLGDGFEAGTFRKPLCLFAYERLPELISRDLASFSARVAANSATAFVQQLWVETVGPIGDDGLPSVVHELRGEREFAIVKMPEPLASPEPFFLGLSLLISDIENTGFRVYCLEMASEDVNSDPFLCSVDDKGTHAIIGTVPLCDSSEFAHLIELSLIGQLPRLNTGNTLMHLVRYAEIG